MRRSISIPRAFSCPSLVPRAAAAPLIPQANTGCAKRSWNQSIFTRPKSAPQSPSTVHSAPRKRAAIAATNRLLQLFETAPRTGSQLTRALMDLEEGTEREEREPRAQRPRRLPACVAVERLARPRQLPPDPECDCAVERTHAEREPEQAHSVRSGPGEVQDEREGEYELDEREAQRGPGGSGQWSASSQSASPWRAPNPASLRRSDDMR